MSEFQKYRRKPELVVARQLEKDETITVGPQEFAQQIKAKRGQWVLAGRNGAAIGVLSSEDFEREFEVEALPADQARVTPSDPDQAPPKNAKFAVVHASDPASHAITSLPMSQADLTKRGK